MTQEQQAIKYIEAWTNEMTIGANSQSEYIKGYRAGVQMAKDVIWAIIKANIKPKKK